MKKHFSFYQKLLAALTTILTIFTLYSSGISTTNNGLANQSNPTIVKAANHKIARHHNRKTRTVYIATRHGRTYHDTRYCRTLRRSHGHIKKISLNRARILGYRPCKVCY